jgi:DNA-binding NtrC family response regulator
VWRTEDDFGETKISGETRSDRYVLLLLVASGVEEFDLPRRGTATVGRAPTAEIHVQAPSVSREHAVITCCDGEATIHDLGSTNGTKVNGDPVGATPVSIRIGDAIRLGDVIAQLRAGHPTRAYRPQFVAPTELDARIADEAERCVRYDHSLAGVTVEVTDRRPTALACAERLITALLRPLDAATARAPGRFDVLLVEIDKKDAVTAAERLRRDLEPREVAVKIGVAAFPADVPSAISLLLAAQLAMHSAEPGKVGLAREGVRMLKVGGREIVVAEPAVVRLYALIERVAASLIPVLIQGETGSGKEIVAEAIHALGDRAEQPLVKINCASLTETLLESELFGHAKGAFTGADAAKPGLFEEADGGTLFLDEIGEMSPALQAKLLRVLEDHRVRRVGATKDRRIDVRIVAATHRDLKREAASGGFRQDLFYRLSAMVLAVPPLRERPREIPLLAERFIALAAEQAQKNPPTLGPDARAALDGYDWPGNIRELRNVVQAAVMHCDGERLDLAHLPPEIAALAADGAAAREGMRGAPSPRPAPRQPGEPLEEWLRDVERAEIEWAMARCGGNQTQTAELLGMPRRTLVYKLKAIARAPASPRPRFD